MNNIDFETLPQLAGRPAGPMRRDHKREAAATLELFQAAEAERDARWSSRMDWLALIYEPNNLAREARHLRAKWTRGDRYAT